MTIERVDPPQTGDERAVLAGYLDYQRATLAGKCDGLSEAQLRERAVPPSSLSLLGLLRHMAEVERAWFRRRLAGEDVPYRWVTDDDPDADFVGVDEADVGEAWGAWEEECDRARTIVAGAPLDSTFETSRRGQMSLRWLLVHLIEEYARHNGHADLLRERLDGTTGE